MGRHVLEFVRGHHRWVLQLVLQQQPPQTRQIHLLSAIRVLAFILNITIRAQGRLAALQTAFALRNQGPRALPESLTNT